MMIRALWTATTGMQAQQKNIDTIANDLGNVSTTGYKGTRVNFADLFYQRLRSAGVTGTSGNNTPVGLYLGNGVRMTGTTKMFSVGSAENTDGPLHMMIDDGGSIARNFFPIDVGNGEIVYTRDGSFTMDADGTVVLSDGAILDGAPQIPTTAQDITVAQDGTIYYNDENGDQQEAGQIQIATFVNPAGLAPIGGNYYEETEASGAATLGTPGDAGFGEILGGWLESSNVSAVEEMVGMITAQRSYEFNSKSIQTSDEMLQVVNNLKQ